MNLKESFRIFRKLPGIRKFSIIVMISIGGIFVISIIQGMLYNSGPSRPTIVLQGPDLEETSKIKNYRILRRKAIDSLIDNKQLTPENLALIRERYPDSLCDCN